MTGSANRWNVRWGGELGIVNEVALLYRGMYQNKSLRPLVLGRANTFGTQQDDFNLLDDLLLAKLAATPTEFDLLVIQMVYCRIEFSAISEV